jgi:predicted dehydrogenase
MSTISVALIWSKGQNTMAAHDFSRRNFVGAAASSAFVFTFVPSRVWGANDRLNIAGIGAGGKGASEINDSAREGCNIVALCDVDDTRAAGTYKKFPGAKKYKDFRVMLEKQKDIDAVTVSTPDHTHAPAAVMAMKLGKHVYCQKPLTHSIYEARVMAETAAKMKVATQMGNQAHAGEPIRRAVELVRAGIIGKVHEAHVWTNRPIWPQGVNRPKETPRIPAGLDWDLWLGPAPVRPYHSAYVPFKWRGFWDFGTGALGDMGCHLMDMAYWSLGLGYPDAVEAESSGGTEESPPTWSIVKYYFPARDKNPPVSFVWYDGNRLPPKHVSAGESLKKFGTVLIGDKGRMYFSRRHTDWLIKPAKALDGFNEPDKTIPRVSNEDAEWIAACKGGPPALSNFARSGPFTEVVLLGNLAVRVGKKFRWDGPAMRSPDTPEVEQFVRREYRKGWKL